MSQNQSLMRLISFVILMLILQQITLLGQARFENKILGRVTNAETGKPLVNVNVFLANTTRGDATDEHGYYLIENIPPGAYDLVFSMIGFELKIAQVQFIGTKSLQYNMKLRPQVLKGKEIAVEATVPKEWRKNLEKFTREFLGDTENASQCKIINPEVLDFEIDKQNDRFIATTDSILIVENRSLGYRLHIILDTFRISKDTLIYATYPRYEELVPQDEDESKQWNENRCRTYSGSFRHFLSSLARGTVEQEYFVLFNDYGKQIASDELTIRPDTSLSLKWLFLNHPLEVIYRGAFRSGESNKYIQEWSGHFPSSNILVRKGYALIDTLGNVYTSFAFIHSGFWYRERIADNLPFDYIPIRTEKN